MNMYDEYLRTVENPDSGCIYEEECGFLSYKLFPQEALIFEIYIREKYRQNKFASVLIDRLIQKAKERNILWLTCIVNLTAINPALSLKSALAYGFVPCKAEGGSIYLKKEIDYGE